MTDRSARHSEEPRFQAAASRFGSIWFRRRRMIAMAKGAVSTECAMMIDQSWPDAPIQDSHASMASAMMISGIVGGQQDQRQIRPLEAETVAIVGIGGREAQHCRDNGRRE